MKVKQIQFYSRLGFHSVAGIPSVFVLAYPRSGSSWLSRLVASATGLPYGQGYPFLKPQVIHLHRYFLPFLNRTRTAYIVRDVRDAFLSYSNALLISIRDKKITEEQLVQRFQVSRDSLDPKNPDYLQFARQLMESRFVSTNWVKHVRLSSTYGLACIRYEDLFADPEGILNDLLEQMGVSVAVNLSKVVNDHCLEKERSQGLPVRSGGVEKWRRFADCAWVEEVLNWAQSELRILGYAI